VERDGQKLDIPVPATFIASLIKKQESFIDPRLPFVIADFAKKSPGRDAGLMVGDKIVGINDIQTDYFDQFKAELKKHKGQEIAVKVIRNNAPAEVKVKVPQEALLGVAPKNVLELERKEYTLLQSIPGGVKMAVNTFDSYIKQLKLIFTPETKAYENLGGFIMLGKAFSPEWDWVRFWSFTAFLSIVLAIMNILPIPALDGGHVMFLLYEVITGRKPNEKFMEYAQIAGMVFLFSLLLYANGNDIAGLFK
jgi:regulator of sigma E protease